MDREEAIEVANTHWWINKTPKEIVEFQLYEDKLCMPYNLYQQAIIKVLGRSVFTHEFARPENLQREFEKKSPKQTPKGIVEALNELIPKERTLFVGRE